MVTVLTEVSHCVYLLLTEIVAMNRIQVQSHEIRRGSNPFPVSHLGILCSDNVIVFIHCQCSAPTL